MELFSGIVFVRVACIIVFGIQMIISKEKKDTNGLIFYGVIYIVTMGMLK